MGSSPGMNSSQICDKGGNKNVRIPILEGTISKAYHKHLPGTLHDYLQQFENAYIELAYVLDVKEYRNEKTHKCPLLNTLKSLKLHWLKSTVAKKNSM